MSGQQEWTPLLLARHFHNLYERAAPGFGYETRAETRAFDPESSNGKLMILVCSEILGDFGAVLAAEREKRKVLARAFESERDLRKRYEDQLAAEREKYDKLLATTGEAEELKKLREQLATEKQATSNAFSEGYAQGYSDAIAAGNGGEWYSDAKSFVKDMAILADSKPLSPEERASINEFYMSHFSEQPQEEGKGKVK